MTRRYIIIFLCFLFVFCILPAPIYSIDQRKPFIWPLQGEILTGFRQPYTDAENSNIIRHTGIDIAGDPGSKVLASANGIVSYTGISPTGGLTIVIKHNMKIRSTYLNLAGIYVSRGDNVKQGDVIASLGAYDDISSEKCHLHFAVIYENTYLNPEQLLKIDYSTISRFLRLSYMNDDYKIY